MAERRMFSRTIISSDEFRSMSAGAQALYLNFGVEADDDGIVGAPVGVRRACGLSESDLEELIRSGFVLAVAGKIVITHWKTQNLIPKDRYHPTQFRDVAARLRISESGAYSLYTDCIQDCTEPVSKPETEVRLGKVSIDTPTPTARARGENASGADGVNLSAEEMEHLASLMGADVRDGYIAHLAEYLADHREKSYDDHCAKILEWWKEDQRKRRKPPGRKSEKSKMLGGSFDTDEFFAGALRRSYGDDPDNAGRMALSGGEIASLDERKEAAE